MLRPSSKNLLPFVIGLESGKKPSLIQVALSRFLCKYGDFRCHNSLVADTSESGSFPGRTFQISLQVWRFQVSQQLGCRHQWIRCVKVLGPSGSERKRPAKKRNLIQLFEKTRSQKIQQSKEKLKIQENKNQKFQIPNSKKTRSPKSKKLNLGNSKNQRQWPSRRLGKLQKHLVVDLGRLSSSSNGK